MSSVLPPPLGNVLSSAEWCRPHPEDLTQTEYAKSVLPRKTGSPAKSVTPLLLGVMWFSDIQEDEQLSWVPGASKPLAGPPMSSDSWGPGKRRVTLSRAHGSKDLQEVPRLNWGLEVTMVLCHILDFFLKPQPGFS